MAEFTKDELAQAIASALKSTGLVGGASNNQPQRTSSSGSNTGPFSASAGRATGEAVGAAATDFLNTQINNAGSEMSASINKAFGDLPGVGSTLSGFGNILLESNQTFMNLSKVGAGFNGDLGELRMGAAMTNMRLGDFANMVGTNSQLLSGFAGGVEGGIRQFRTLSDEMMRGPISQFQNLGFSIEEANEFILKNMEAQRRQARFRNADGTLNSQLMLESSLQMAKSLDVMAKVAGKELKQMQDDVVERGRVGATQAALRLMEQRGVTNARETFDKMQTELQAGPKVLQDLFSDVTQLNTPLSESTRAFSSMNGEALELARQARVAMQSGDQEQAVRLARRAVAVTAAQADSERGLTISTLQQVNSTAAVQAGVLEETGNLIDQIKARSGQIGESLNSTQGYVNTFNRILQDVAAAQSGQTSGTGPGQGIQTMLAEMDRVSRDASSRIGENIASQMSNNTRMVDLLQTAFKEFEGIVTASANNIENMLMLIPGAVGANNATADGADLDTQISRMSPPDQALVRIVQDQAQSAEKRTEALEALRGLVTSEGLLITGINMDEVRSRQGIPTPHALGGTVKAGDFIKVGEYGPETMIAGMDGAIIPNMKNAMNRIPAVLQQLQQDGEIIPNMKNAMNRIPAVLQQLQQDITQTGVPMTQSAMANMANMGTDDIGALVQHAQTTNELLSRILGVNSTQVRVGEKQLRSVRGAGNLMNGIGRA